MNKSLFLGAGALVVAAALVVGPSMVAGRNGKTAGTGPGGADKTETSAAAGTVYSVRTERAVKKTLQSYIEVNGDVVAETKVAVVPDTAGKLVSLKADIGSVVKKGQLIAEIDPSRPGATYSLSPVYAPISGTVTSAPLSVGATVSAAATIVEVGAMDRLQVEAKIPERDVGRLKVGLKAQVSLEAFPGERFAAAVERVAPVVDSISRSKEIVLKFENPDERINAGMFARIKLDTVAYPNRVAVPEEAVTALRGSSYVYVLVSDGTVELRAVACGVTVDGMTEIREGVAEGESVVTQGQHLLSDGAKVRAIDAAGSKA